MGCKKEIDLNFVVAHSHEARAVIDFYHLSKSTRHTAFNVFENNYVHLIISGQGRLNASAATAYMGAINCGRSESTLWVNVGIAGHRCHPIGSIWRVNKITDRLSGRNYYPFALQPAKQAHASNIQPLVNMNSEDNKLKGCALMTVDTAVSTYPEDCLYDMEASGFFQTALRFSSLEKVTCFKVVSDNLEQPVNTVDKKNIVRIMSPGMTLIDRYIHHLVSIMNIEKPMQDIDFKDLKMSFSEKEIIRELIESLHVHGISTSDAFNESVTAGQLIQTLKNKLKRTGLTV